MKNESSPLVYIYALCDPRTGRVRYVGKTQAKPRHRYYKHLSDRNGTDARGRWVASLHSLGLLPIMTILEVGPRENWEQVERHWIQRFRATHPDLLNISDGGDGAPGYKHTEESRKKMSAARKGRPVPESSLVNLRQCQGQPIPEDAWRASIEKSRGVPRSEEVRAKISAAKKGVPAPEGVIEKLASLNRGKKRTPEAVEKTRQALTGKARAPFSEETRKRMSEAAKKRGFTPEHRANIMAAQKRRREKETLKE